MATHNFRGLTAKQAAEIKDSEPLEVSLFIGGREFPLDGIALTGDTSLFSALVEQRQDLDDTIKNHAAEEARMLEMTVDETRLFLVERALYLDRFIDELSQARSGHGDGPKCEDCGSGRIDWIRTTSYSGNERYFCDEHAQDQSDFGGNAATRPDSFMYVRQHPYRVNIDT